MKQKTAERIVVTARPKARKEHAVWRSIVRHRQFYLLGLPGILSFIIFKYFPMYGILIAFQDYNPFAGVMKSEWVGFDHFIRLFTDPDFFMILRNALVLSLLGICLFPAPILLALLLNELRSELYKRMVQTVIYLPHFVSWVIVVSLTYIFLSSEIGLVNKLLTALSGDKINFLFENQYFYPLIMSQDLWRNIGWGSIIYMAAIAGVDTSLYDAAKMDGAGKMKQIWHVTIPSIMPTIVILFILQLGSTLDVNFEQLWLMQNPLNTHISEVFETYVFKVGVGGSEYSYSTAIGIFKSVVGLVLIVVANKMASKRGHEGIW